MSAPLLLRPWTAALLAAVARVAWRGEDDAAAIRAILDHRDPGAGPRELATGFARAAVDRRPRTRCFVVVLVAGLALACAAALRASGARGASWLTAPPAPAAGPRGPA